MAAQQEAASPSHESAPQPGEAEPPLSVEHNAEQRERAAEEFKLGREASREGDTARACVHFRQSLAWAEAPGTLLNLGICEQALGNLLPAMAHYQAVLARLPRSDERWDLAKQRYDELDAKLPQVQLQLAPSAEGALVLLDGRAVLPDELAGPLRLLSGAHEIVVRRSGHDDQSYALPLVTGQRVSLLLQAGKQRPPASEPVKASTAEMPSSLPPPNTSKEASSATPWLVGGTGVLLLSAGVATAWMAERVEDDLQSECENGVCTRAGIELANDGENLQLLTAVFATLGGLCLGTSAVLWLAPSGGADSPTEVGVSMRGTF